MTSPNVAKVPAGSLVLSDVIVTPLSRLGAVSSKITLGSLITASTSALITCAAHTVSTADGESASDILANHYIVGGKDTTTHGDLPRSVERYLISYCAWKILKRDSSVDSSEAQLELQALIQEIVNSYAMISDDVQYIPQLTSWDDWSV